MPSDEIENISIRFAENLGGASLRRESHQTARPQLTRGPIPALKPPVSLFGAEDDTNSQDRISP